MLGIPNYGRRIRANPSAMPRRVGSYIGDEIRYSETQTFIKNGWKTMLARTLRLPIW